MITSMRVSLIFILSVLTVFTSFGQGQYDLVIVGGTPGGIMTAISAAREGKTSVLLERTAHVGGLPANGLGATDIATRGATTGLFAEFVGGIREFYVTKYGENSQQVKDCSDGYHFEASVAEQIFETMLAKHKDKITVLKMRQFDSDDENITMQNDRIVSIKVLNRETKKLEEFKGKIFADATYEGDLGASAKVPFRTGREGYDEFQEPGSGRVYKYWGGGEGTGSTLQADNAVQSYNYRLCLTKNAANRLAVAKPLHYNREEYVSLVEDVWTGRHTGFQMMSITNDMLEANRKHIAKGNPTQLPGDVWGIARLTNMVVLPNGKTDANNQHMAFISTDLPEENWPWPTSAWEWRDKFAIRLQEYIQGLIYFAQNDKDLPEHFRTAAKEWGFAKDEYQDNNNFPRQVYVREGRRFEGLYFFTAKDAVAVPGSARPPLHASSITASHYALDSHAVRKREAGRIHLDGFLSYPSDVYTVPYGIMVPKQVDNLLLPVPVSGSHIGFSTLRMEPCWMAIGQAAGVAASVAIDDAVKVQHVDQAKLQQSLLKQKATLIYYKDIKVGDPDFDLVQRMGLLGYLPEWEAKLSEPVGAVLLARWTKISRVKFDEADAKLSRKDALVKLEKALTSK